MNITDREHSPPPLQHAERWFLVALCVLALAVRLIHLNEIQSNPFFDHPRLDALFHDIWAQSIASGEIMGDKVFFRAPVYPYFLAGVYALFGHDYLIPRVIQHLVGVVSLLLLYFLSRRVFGVQTAIIATLLALFYPMLVYFEGELLFESLLVFAILLWLIMIERWKDRTSLSAWFAIGVVYGLACSIRPLFLGMTPLIIIWLVWRIQRARIGEGRRMLTGLFLGCVVVILPVTIRNYVVGHDLVLIASQGGVNFFIGNNPAADGYSSMMPGPRGPSWENRDITYVVERILGHPPLPSEESWFWYTKGVDFIINSPLKFGALLMKKAYLFWNWYEIQNNQNFYTFKKYSHVLEVLPFGFWFVGPLSLLGMCIALRRRRGLFHVAFVASYSFVIVMFFVCDRFRLPVVPLLCMFAAYAITALIDQVRNVKWRLLMVTGAIGCCFAVFVNSNLYEIKKDTDVRDAVSLGIVEINKGNFDEAISYFAEASKRNASPWPNLFLNWGVAEWKKGNMQVAMEKFHQELTLYPEASLALSNLASIHLSLGMYDSALYFGRRAVEVKPYETVGYLIVAQAYRKKHEWKQAATILEGGVRACGEDFVEGQLLLAETYGSLEKPDKAKRMYRAIIGHRWSASQPSYEPEYNYLASSLTAKGERWYVAMALYGLGHLYAAQKQLDSATVYFKDSARLLPEYADAWADLGVAYMQTRHYLRADSAFQIALQLQPENHVYLYNYGTLMGTMGQLMEAREAFSHALKVRPDFELARKQLALTDELLRRMLSRD